MMSNAMTRFVSCFDSKVGKRGKALLHSLIFMVFF
jgi:hypothetical protein